MSLLPTSELMLTGIWILLVMSDCIYADFTCMWKEVAICRMLEELDLTYFRCGAMCLESVSGMCLCVVGLHLGEWSCGGSGPVGPLTDRRQVGGAQFSYSFCSPLNVSVCCALSKKGRLAVWEDAVYQL